MNLDKTAGVLEIKMADLPEFVGKWEGFRGKLQMEKLTNK